MANFRLYHVLDQKEDNYLCPQAGEVLQYDVTDPLTNDDVCPVCGAQTRYERPVVFHAPRKPDGFAIMKEGKCIKYAQVHMQFTAERIARDLDAEAIQLPFYGESRS